MESGDFDDFRKSIFIIEGESEARTMELEVGKLYQVYYEPKGFPYSHNWILAEYLSTVPAHDYQYSNVSLGGKAGITIGPNKVGHNPTTHYFKTAWAGARFGIHDLKHIRPASPESVAEVARLRSEIEAARVALEAAKQELRTYCL